MKVLNFAPQLKGIMVSFANVIKLLFFLKLLHNSKVRTIELCLVLCRCLRLDMS